MIYKILALSHFLFIFLSLITSTSTGYVPKGNQFLCRTFRVPPSSDLETGVLSKDFNITPTIPARIYTPKTTTSSFRNLPLILYFHGGGRFCAGSAFSRPHHKFSNSLSSSRAVVISVEYRSAPTNPISFAYDDSWAALKWVVSRPKQVGPSAADLKRVFLAGDGAGANIAHNIAIRVGLENLGGLEIAGLVLIHPLLWGEKEKPIYENEIELKRRALVNSMWRFVCPTSKGLRDPWVNPAMDPNLWRLGGKYVMVFVAGLDPVAKGNYGYVEALRKSRWGGHVEAVEAKGYKNGFFLNPNYSTSYDARFMLNRIQAFILKK